MVASWMSQRQQTVFFENKHAAFNHVNEQGNTDKLLSSRNHEHVGKVEGDGQRGIGKISSEHLRSIFLLKTQALLKASDITNLNSAFCN